MTKYILLVVIIFFSKEIWSQNSGIVIKSTEGQTLINIDSLAFKDDLCRSLFYADSASGKAYTGQAVISFGQKAVDSINLTDGYRNGWCKLYIQTNEEQLKLHEVEYLNQKMLLYTHSTVETKRKKRLATSSHFFNRERFSILVIYKHSNKIIVKEYIYGQNKKTKRTFKFRSLAELESYYKTHSLIYSFCQKSGFFREI